LTVWTIISLQKPLHTNYAAISCENDWRYCAVLRDYNYMIITSRP